MKLPFMNAAAITFGNTVHYLEGYQPSMGVPPYGGDGSFFLHLGMHEYRHTNHQYQILGPFYLPTFLLGEGFARMTGGINFLEQDADNYSIRKGGVYLKNGRYVAPSQSGSYQHP